MTQNRNPYQEAVQSAVAITDRNYTDDDSQDHGAWTHLVSCASELEVGALWGVFNHVASDVIQGEADLPASFAVADAMKAESRRRLDDVEDANSNDDAVVNLHKLRGARNSVVHYVVAIRKAVDEAELSPASLVGFGLLKAEVKNGQIAFYRLDGGLSRRKTRGFGEALLEQDKHAAAYHVFESLQKGSRNEDEKEELRGLVAQALAGMEQPGSDESNTTEEAEKADEAEEELSAEAQALLEANGTAYEQEEAEATS